MMQYVWCKNEECRIPAFRCILCRHDCYEVRGRIREGEVNPAFELLRNSGRFKECFVMKRRENAESQSQLSFFERNEKKDIMENSEQLEPNGQNEPNKQNEPNGQNGDKGLFLMEDGRIRPISSNEYTSSTLYQAIESFSIECKLVRPEESGNMVFEGKKPSKKTVPILVKRDGECVILNSWEELESQPSQLADAQDVVGAMPVKQVFVLKRK
jgi:hypothetical protein